MRVRLMMVWAGLSGFGVACDLPPYVPPYEAPEVVADVDVVNETAPDTSSCAIQPTLSDINAKYFQFSCVFGGCHESGSAKGGLNLESSNLHAQLVNVGASDSKASARGKLLVVPGDPDASFLVQKLAGTMGRDEGNLMPDGTEEPIDPACRIAMLRQWISDGALDN